VLAIVADGDAWDSDSWGDAHALDSRRLVAAP
jgi:hypothetical protein